MRRRILFLLVAGGVASAALPGAAPGAEGAPDPIYVEGITFDEPVRMDYTDPAPLAGPAEPSIKVGPGGVIYLAAATPGRAAPAWYSKDDGATWQNLPSPAGIRENGVTGVGTEGDFAVDDAGGVYFVDLTPFAPTNVFTRWSGNGDVWEYTENIAPALWRFTEGEIPWGDDRPWLTYQHGAVHLQVDHFYSTGPALYRSRDGGRTWEMTFENSYRRGMLVANRDTDDVYLYGRCTGETLCAATSRDQGDTWTQVEIGRPPRGQVAPVFVSVGIDRAGNVYGTFADTGRDGSGRSGCDVYLDVSTDRGQSFRRYRVSPETGCSTFPWVAGGEDGRVSVVWYHNDSETGQDGVPASSEWRVQAAVVTGATSDEPVVTWGELDRVIHRGPLRQDLLDYQQIDVGPDGRFHIGFAEDAFPPCDGDLSHGALTVFDDKCTTWVAQEGGPRAIPHAADATTIETLEASGGAGSLEVSGTATFGRAAPSDVFEDGDDASPLDLRAGTVVRPSAQADHLVFELAVKDVPERIGAPDLTVLWPFEVGEAQFGLYMQSQPRRWEVCPLGGGECTRVRGDLDAGGDRYVALVPLDAIGAPPGESVSFTDPVTAGVGSHERVLPLLEQDASYAVPAAAVMLTVTDDAGAEVASTTADLSGDLSSFAASLQDLEPGDYTVTAEACFDDNCSAEVVDITVS